MRNGQDATRARHLRAARTDAEHRLWQHLRGRRLLDVKFRRQVQVGPFFVDFVSHEAGLAIELDGSQHLDAPAYDAARTRVLERQGLRVLRFWNDDVLARTADVLDAIAEAVLESFPHPPCGHLLPQAGEG